MERLPKVESQKSQEQIKNPILVQRDKYKEHASELQKKTGQIQAAKHETILYRLMSRTEDNSELTNAINGFLDTLDRRSRYGDETKPLGKEAMEKLTKFFQEKSKEIDGLWGNRPA
ncbi:MAG: hypothetical protein HYT98_01640 [Candidatus Sungbacteria bacterium]|nr:hypothetical protein [Candidatus Sungbacteria bacterium]